MAEIKQMAKHSISLRPRHRRQRKKRKNKSNHHRPAFSTHSFADQWTRATHFSVFFPRKMSSLFLFHLPRQITTMSAHANNVLFIWRLCLCLLLRFAVYNCTWMMQCDDDVYSCTTDALTVAAIKQRNISPKSKRIEIVSNTNWIYIRLHKRNEKLSGGIPATNSQWKSKSMDAMDNNVCDGGGDGGYVLAVTRKAHKMTNKHYARKLLLLLRDSMRCAFHIHKWVGFSATNGGGGAASALPA